MILFVIRLGSPAGTDNSKMPILDDALARTASSLTSSTTVPRTGFLKRCALCERKYPKASLFVSVMFKHVLALRYYTCFKYIRN